MFHYNNLRDAWELTLFKWIKAPLNQYMQQGHLFRDRWHKFVWLECSTMELMATTWINLILRDGYLSRDTRLQMVLSLVLQSSLSCRGGDIAGSRGYQGVECQQWKDIAMNVRRVEEVLVPGVKGMEAHVVLRYTKEISKHGFCLSDLPQRLFANKVVADQS